METPALVFCLFRVPTWLISRQRYNVIHNPSIQKCDPLPCCKHTQQPFGLNVSVRWALTTGLRNWTFCRRCWSNDLSLHLSRTMLPPHGVRALPCRTWVVSCCGLMTHYMFNEFLSSTVLYNAGVSKATGTPYLFQCVIFPRGKHMET